MNKIIEENHIFLSEKLNTKLECLNFLSIQSEKLSISNNSDEVLKALLEREKEISTGFTDGIAIPHTQSSTILKPALIFIKNREGIEWQTLDGKLVHLIIAIFVPKDSEENLHLKLLSSLARKLMDKDFRNRLLNTQNKKVILELLSQ